MADPNDPAADNLRRVTRNLRRLQDQKAPEDDLRAYLQEEGFATPDAFHKAVLTVRAGKRLPLQGFTDALMSGLMLGFDDEFAAAARATGGALFGEPGTWSERYNTALDSERAGRELYRRDNPVTSTVANIVGSLANPITQLVKPAAGMVGNMVRGGAAGAGIGGATGFGMGEGGLDQRLESAGEGAAWGAGIGLAAPPVMAALGTGARVAAESTPGRWVADHVVSPVFRGAGAIAEKMAKRAPGRAASAAPPEGGPPIVQDGFAARISEGARGMADDVSGQGIARRGAVERLVRRLERDEITPQQFEKALAELGPDAALFLGGGPNTAMLAKTTARLPGKGMKVAQEGATTEARSIGPRMMGEIEKDVSSDTRFFSSFEKAAQRRTQDAEKLFGTARGGNLVISDDMQEMMKVPAIKEAIEAVQADATKFGVQLSPGDIMHRVKQKMGDIADAAFTSGKPVNKQDMGKLADQWRKAFHAANPAWAKADASYEASSKVMGAIDEGRRFLIGGTGEQGTRNAADALASRFKDMSTQEQEAFRVGVASAIREKLMAGPDGARAFAKQLDQSGLLREKLVEIVGPVNAERIFNMAGKEMKRAQGWRGVMGGSDTAWNAAAMADDGLPGLANPARTGGPWTRMWDYGFQRLNEGMRGNEAVRGELAEMLFSSDPTTRARIIDEINRAAGGRVNKPIPRAVTAGGASQAGQNRER